MKKFIHEHYHFIIAATALFAYTIMGGLMNNISSLYLVPVSDTLGVSRTSVSLTQSIRSLATFGANLMFGVIYHKFGFRKLCSFGLLLMGLSFAGLASSQTVISYAVFSVLIGILTPSAIRPVFPSWSTNGSSPTVVWCWDLSRHPAGSAAAFFP